MPLSRTYLGSLRYIVLRINRGCFQHPQLILTKNIAFGLLFSESVHPRAIALGRSRHSQSSRQGRGGALLKVNLPHFRSPQQR